MIGSLATTTTIPAEKKIDQEWAELMKGSTKEERSKVEAHLGIKRPSDSPWSSYTDKSLGRLIELKFYPGFYFIDNFASYQVGSPKISWGKDRGYTFKVFFEFKNPQKDLTPNRYREFSRKLSEAGFEGDSKIPVLPGWIRFAWNNIIIHAPTIGYAKIAEKVGLDFFSGELLLLSRS